MKRASIYRFGDCVAVSMNGSVGYLQQNDAQKLVNALNHVITSIARERFAQSSVGTFEVQYAPTSGEACALSEASLGKAPKGWDMVEGDDKPA